MFLDISAGRRVTMTTSTKSLIIAARVAAALLLGSGSAIAGDGRTSSDYQPDKIIAAAQAPRVQFRVTDVSSEVGFRFG
jgi:hypothetical protein